MGVEVRSGCKYLLVFYVFYDSEQGLLVVQNKYPGLWEVTINIYYHFNMSGQKKPRLIEKIICRLTDND